MSRSSNGCSGSEAGGVWRTIEGLVKGRWLEILIILLIGAVLVDNLFNSGNLFFNRLESWSNTNEGFASILLSALLLAAYVLQFRSNDRQRVLMEQQKDIMIAGYTPVIGVLNQEVKDYTDDDTKQVDEELLLEIVNRGNSLAQDLAIRFEIEHEGRKSLFDSNSVPLIRVEQGTWWTSGSGGTLSHEEEKTRFTAEVSLNTKQGEDLSITEAAEKLFQEENDDKIDRFSVITYLTYKDAMNNPQTIRTNKYNVIEPRGEGSPKLSNANPDAEY